MKFITLVLALLAIASASLAQTPKGVLHVITDAAKHQYGYADSKGDTIIPVGKYPVCYTNIFDKFAIVLVRGKGFVGIDRNEKILFNMYIFDNGPDYPACGLFRIVKDGKIGYAGLNGNIVIRPQFDCAYPFKNGIAEVGTGCKEKKNGEHHFWTGGIWYTIDKTGNTVKKQL